MKIETIIANDDKANIIRNLYPLYLYDLSEIFGNVPNVYGIYEEDSIQTLAEQYAVQDLWFKHPNELFPFIIMVNDMPAGFILVSTGKYAPKTTDYYVYETFLLRPYRGKDIAETAVIQIFERFKGKWELYTNPTENNKRGQGFWNKTLQKYTNGKYTQEVGETFDGVRMIFRFTNEI